MTRRLPPLFADVETKEGLRDVDDDTIHTGAMIALRPRQDHIDRLVVVDGEEPAELHCTILFMGKGADYSYDTRARIIHAMREVALKHRQVTGNGWNVGIFNPLGEQPCIALGVGGTEMVEIRNSIIGALQGMDLLQVPEQHEPWMPHVTLNYTDDFKLALDYLDLTGEVVFDAIRVVFSGIVDDIPLQTVSSEREGYAGGNRYAFAPPNLLKSFTFNIPSRFVVEEKARHVRTAAGARRFGQPIGSVIVADGSVLKNLKEVDSDYEGYSKYNVRGQDVYVAKEGNKFVAYDASDNVINSDAKEDALLRALDRSTPKKTGESKPLYDNFKRVDSEYEGYVQYQTPGGDVWRDPKTNAFYDADDNQLSDVELRRMNTGLGRSNKPKTYPDPGGLKKVKSDYEGYDKFIGQNGKPVYRWQEDGKFYDENDNEVDVNDYNGEKVKADLTKKPKLDSDESRKTVDTTGMPDSLNSKQQTAFSSAIQSAVMQIEDPTAKETLTKLAEGVKAGTATPADVIRQIEELQKNARNSSVKYTLGSTLSRMKNAMRLYQEAKIFASLVEMDPFLRAQVIQYKLVTPGGRIGTDRTLGSRSNGQNWIERTAMGRLPKYIRIVANGLLKAGHSKSRAIAMAVAAMKRWARGGDNVRPQVQAAAVKALAEWEALVAAA